MSGLWSVGRVLAASQSSILNVVCVRRPANMKDDDSIFRLMVRNSAYCEPHHGWFGTFRGGKLHVWWRGFAAVLIEMRHVASPWAVVPPAAWETRQASSLREFTVDPVTTQAQLAGSETSSTLATGFSLPMVLTSRTPASAMAPPISEIGLGTSLSQIHAIPIASTGIT